MAVAFSALLNVAAVLAGAPADVAFSLVDQHDCAGQESMWAACAEMPDCFTCTPQNCKFEDWSDWSHTKGCQGICIRRRSVKTPNNECGKVCEGPVIQTKECIKAECVVESKDCELSDWEDWTKCKNDRAQRSRSRSVVSDAKGQGQGCDTYLNETSACGTKPSPLDCRLSTWHDWTTCSVTCGTGHKVRQRLVAQLAMYGGEDCDVDQPLKEMQVCSATNNGTDVACKKENCALTLWSDWIGCDVASPTQRYRKRDVKTGAGGDGSRCEAIMKETKGCDKTPKPCVLGKWSEWSTCDRTCDGGQRTRHRALKEPAEDGGLCEDPTGRPYDTQEIEACGTAQCNPRGPDDCQPGEWNDWHDCSSQCNIGVWTRERSIKKFAVKDGYPCEGVALVEVGKCDNTQKCQKVNCTWGDWGEWLGCTRSCEGGTQRRSRVIKKEPLHGGKVCEPDNFDEIRPCNTGSCNACRDGRWGDWTAWSSCSQSCDSGYTSRKREVTVDANHCGKPAEGMADEYRKCENLKPCQAAVDCDVSDWSEWSACSATCFGIREKVRQFTKFQQGAGNTCNKTALKMVAPCNPGEKEPVARDCETTLPKDKDCVFEDWAAWSTCTATCGGGQITRMRHVLSPSRGKGEACQGTLEQTKACNQVECPGPKCQDCKWSQWGDWGKCTGCERERWRTRTIAKIQNVCGKACETTEAKQVKDCPRKRECDHVLYCAWSEWSQSKCPVGMCGTQSMKRERKLGLYEELPNQAATATADGTTSANNSANVAKTTANTTANVAKTTANTTANTSGNTTANTTANATKPDIQENVVTENAPGVGNWGGECTCPDGKTYQVGDWNDSCESLACIGGSMKKCNRHAGAWSQRKVVCKQAAQQASASGGQEQEADEGKPDESSSDQDDSLLGRLKSIFEGNRLLRRLGDSSARRRRRRRRRRPSSKDDTQSVANEGNFLFQTYNGGICSGTEVKFDLCPANPSCIPKCVPEDCEFSDWGDWSAPTMAGLCERERGILKMNNECGTPCQNVIVQTKAENCSAPPEDKQDCAFSDWSTWSVCPASTRAQRYRIRSIATMPAMGGEDCIGKLKETSSCATADKRDCQLTEWSKWEDCSKSCGEGVHHRLRRVKLYARGGGLPCSGRLEELAGCNIKACVLNKKDCEFGDWEDWSRCAQGSTQKYRVRQIAQAAVDGGEACKGDMSETKACEKSPTDCLVGPWVSWSTCDTTCNGGQRHRTRQVRQWGENGGEACKHGLQLSQMLPCNSNVECFKSTDCKFKDWGEWQPCTATCGNGAQMRNRTVLQKRSGNGRGCSKDTSEIRACLDVPECERTDCEMSDWTDWSTCTKSCEGGQQSRKRTIVKEPENKGEMCEKGVRDEVRPCNPQNCTGPCVDGTWKDWTSWSNCSKTCDVGVQWRHRKFGITANACGTPATGDSRQIQECNKDVKCVPDVDCKFTDWTVWTECSSSCLGITKRERDFEVLASGKGTACSGPLMEIAPCNPSQKGKLPDDCPQQGEPVDCVLGDWGDWSACSVTCGDGQRRHQRIIVRHAKFDGAPCGAGEGHNLDVSLEDVQSCQQPACGKPPGAKDCAWGDWEDWGDCDQCGGQQKRIRQVKQFSELGGDVCEAVDSEQVQACPRNCYEKYYCTWGEWEAYGACSVTCGATGARKRTRSLKLVGDGGVPQSLYEVDGRAAAAAQQASEAHELYLQAKKLEARRVPEVVGAFCGGVLSLLAILAVVRLPLCQRAAGGDRATRPPRDRSGEGASRSFFITRSREQEGSDSSPLVYPAE